MARCFLHPRATAPDRPDPHHLLKNGTRGLYNEAPTQHGGLAWPLPLRHGSNPPLQVEPGGNLALWLLQKGNKLNQTQNIKKSISAPAGTTAVCAVCALCACAVQQGRPIYTVDTKSNHGGLRTATPGVPTHCRRACERTAAVNSANAVGMIMWLVPVGSRFKSSFHSLLLFKPARDSPPTRVV